MPSILFKCAPYSAATAAQALEAGVNGLVVPDENLAEAAALGRAGVFPLSAFYSLRLSGKESEQDAAGLLASGVSVILERPWQVIPVENLLALAQNASNALPQNACSLSAPNNGRPSAQNNRPLAENNGAKAGCGRLVLEAATLEEARLASGILERGADAVLLLPEALAACASIVEELGYVQPPFTLAPARILEIRPVGLGHRVCIDTTSLLRRGQGMLVGNSAAFTFLTHAETEFSEYVAPRPFRINAGALHSYCFLPGDRSAYLGELAAGSDVLVTDSGGFTRKATVGRIKLEQRPLLLVRAGLETEGGKRLEGAVFLQNAETVHLVRPDGSPVSVVSLQPGAEVLCHVDTAGRHFGLRITEDITE